MLMLNRPTLAHSVCKICRANLRPSARSFGKSTITSINRPSRSQEKPTAAAAPPIYMEGVDPVITKFQEIQKNAPRPTAAESSKTLMSTVKFATLSTISTGKPETQGFPFGSVVDIAVDELGRPIFATSTLSPHTSDLLADARCCATVTAAGYQGPQDSRFTLVGRATAVPEAERAAARELYMKRHPDAFWVDFGDFRWFRIEPISGWYIAGFGGSRKVTAEEYLSSRPDPVAPFSGPVCGHMNKDHMGDMLAMVAHYAGLPCESVKMLDLDRLGVNMEAKREGSTFKLRLPFIRPAEDRKGIKDVIVEMTNTAKAALAAEGRQEA